MKTSKKIQTGAMILFSIFMWIIIEFCRTFSMSDGNFRVKLENWNIVIASYCFFTCIWISLKFLNPKLKESLCIYVVLCLLFQVFVACFNSTTEILIGSSLVPLIATIITAIRSLY